MLDYHAGPHLMGILNLHSRSYCPEGRKTNVRDAVTYAKQMVADGADIIDIGGEPTNPQIQSFSLSLQEELDTVIPVISALSNEVTVPISIDTSQPEVMHAAINAGASIINDVRALRREGALETASHLDVPVCIMHMEYPDGMSGDETPVSTDIVSHVTAFLTERRKVCIDAGIKAKNIILDPGFGAGSFGKSAQQNCRLVEHFETFTLLGSPVLAGLSRKTFIGDILNQPAEERVYGSLALASLLAYKGANIIRAHDVKATKDVIHMLNAVKEAK